MYALIDGNNFFCSCERVFQPHLQHKPLVVLSNNDGCAIARSEEAKNMGIKMAAPYFAIKHLEESAGLVALSANFTLYGDMSARMMSIAAEMGQFQEIYSIDESFIRLIPNDDHTAKAHACRAKILQWTGLPTCVGIGATKTLAKLANHIAKSADRKPGSYPARLAQVCNLSELSARQMRILLEATDVADIWGVGRRLTQQLYALEIQTAWQFMQMDVSFIRKRWNVVLERTWHELHGMDCLQIEAIESKKEIAYTRSFGQAVTSLIELENAVTEFASHACVKLRKQKSVTAHVLVFIRTSPFRAKDMQYSSSTTTPLAHPTADTRVIVQAALEGLRKIYKPQINYCKAGVLLVNLSPETHQQTSFAPAHANIKQHQSLKLMQMLDDVNQRLGAGTLKLGTTLQGHKQWAMRQEKRTPHYTTKLSDIAIAKCT